MKLIRILNQIVDVDQIVHKEMEPKGMKLSFRNGDTMHVVWRDEIEKNQIMVDLESILKSLA